MASFSSDDSNIRKHLFSQRRLSILRPLEESVAQFSPGDRLVLYVLLLVLSVSAFGLLAGANAAASSTIPSSGGSLVEGVVGSARFINPLLALSESDRDITTLVYSGLMRVRPNGELVPDLASSYEISPDGTTYTFTLRPDLTFHDGQPLTSADILFTVQRAQTPDIKSVRRADWEGVTVTTPDERTVVFKLPRAYSPFLENTTIGILPKHLWQHVTPEEFPFNPLNTHPVGSGPYVAARSETNPTGSLTRFELDAFKDFALGKPNLTRITFLFYPNEEARVAGFNAGRIDSLAGVTPEELNKISVRDVSIVRATLPRTFGVFLNQNKNPVLAEAAVREALDAAIDKRKLVEAVLDGYGDPLTGPIPPGVLGTIAPATPQPFRIPTAATSSSETVQRAQQILRNAGWTFNETGSVWVKGTMTLAFTLSTADEPELAEAAQYIVDAWQEAGIKVELHMYPISELNTLILRPRNYDAVLFGEVVGRSLDLYAFWHSSQRNDPGLNLALYTNSRVDDLLAEARTTPDRRARTRLYREFATIVSADRPAIFLFAPEFIYIVPPQLQGLEIGPLTSPEERFANAHEWYTDSERVWNIFIDQIKN